MPPDFPISERFLGTKTKSCFEASDWSPMGISDRGNCLLAVSFHSDRQVHFKIYDYIEIHGISCNFEEVYSLIDILRVSWLCVPFFGNTGERSLLSDMCPSMSFYRARYTPRSFVKWSNELLHGEAVLVSSWNALVFIWIISKLTCDAIGCFEACTEFDSIDDIRVHVIEGSLIVVTVDTMTSPTKKWSFETKHGPMDSRPTLRMASCTVEELPMSPPILRTPNPTTLSVANSQNAVYQISAVRTRKGVQILSQAADTSPETIADAFATLFESVVMRPNMPLVDIVQRIAFLYKPINCDAKSTISGDILAVITSRFVSSADQIKCEMSMTQRDRLRIAYALHVLYCRLDPIVRVVPKSAMMSERRDLLSKISGIELTDDAACTVCGSLAHRELVGNKVYNVCHDRDHRVPLCMSSMEPLLVGNISECCWCFSVYHVNDQDSVSICQICRVGIVRPI